MAEESVVMGETPEVPGSLSISDAAALFNQVLDAPETSTDEPKKKEPAVDTRIDTAIDTKLDTEAKPEDTGSNTEEPEPKFTVKIDGVEVEVPLSELRAGYQKQAASDQRFQQAAETRKSADAEMAKAREERKTYAENLNTFVVRLEGVLEDSNKIDWDALLKSDPVLYLQQRNLQEKRQAALQQYRTELGRVVALEKADNDKAQEAHLTEQAAILAAKLPEWSDPATSQAEKTALRDYLLKNGYTRETVEKVSNAADVILARKAMLYDQMMAKAKAASKKVSQLPTRVMTPGAGEPPGIDKRSAAYQKLAKSGSVTDAAAMFATLL
jgi:hypothetical protein